ncbi:argonaute-like protein [Lactarius akahatsu]|uniref:Argonaute-like protein n=1 Tax=Lactarius akahatsu TaxID=416441 RepID=A0AAD4QH20_9AGAM|nr:argonaute-like protein [Lactarius akahatsu]
MPPKATPGELGRGGRGGRRGGARGGGRGGGRGPSPSHSGPPTPGGAPQSGGFPTRVTPVSGGPAVQRSLIPAAHVSAISVRRTGRGTAGWPVKVLTNNFAIELNQGTIYHYDVISPADRPLPAARNFEIIQALQTQVEPGLFARPGVYDGRKNLFTAYELPFEAGGREFSVPIGTEVFAVCLTHVASIDLEYDLDLPRVLQRFLQGEQRHDNTVLTAITALNVVVRMEPNLIYPSNGSFYMDHETRDIGGGIVLWRGYFQSVRPAIGRMVINIDISTGAMYMPGPLIDVALAILGRPGNPNALAPRQGLPDSERIRIQRFITPGLKITTSYDQGDPNQAARLRVVRRLSREGARDLTFELAGGQSTTVADYFRQKLHRPLRFPDVICVELSSGALIPLELCHVPPGQIMRKQVPPDKTNSVLEFAKTRPNDRLGSIVNGLGVLDYNQSEYVREFGMTVSNEPIRIQARVLDAPTLRYHQSSEEPHARPRDGAWNLIDKRMFTPTNVANWMIVVYERQQRFDDQVANQMASDLVRACEAVGEVTHETWYLSPLTWLDLIGISINPQPALIKWESGQGNIGQQLRAAGGECQRRTKNLPTLIVVVLPEGGNDIYTAVKHFGDVATGVVTQCMKSSKCFRAKPQYYANITLKLNVKLGGVNSVLESPDIPFLTDSANPTIVMGADVIHPAPGSGDRPSFTSLVGSIDTSAVRYVSTMEVQTSRQEIIDAMESMSTYVLTQYKTNTGKYPKRILFYRDGVSEGQFATVIQDELPLIRSACKKLGFNPTITFIVVSRRHHVRFFPRFKSESDRSGNCFAGTVVDSDIVNPVEFDFYLQSHGGLLGTSRPAHYNVLIDENRLTADGLQSITYALCHVYARATRSVSVPAPVYYAKIVCARSKHHFDPQLGLDLTISETATDTTEAATTLERFRQAFKPTHERQKKLMYFC